EITEPIARLYNRALKIHSNLPKWSHHCIALKRSNALTFQHYINSHAITFYFQIKNVTSPALAALHPLNNIRPVRFTRSVSQALINSLYENNYGQARLNCTFMLLFNLSCIINEMK
ncbi:MAG: hypothetical protein ACRCZO_09700, partial [Cetobacterium sp.]